MTRRTTKNCADCRHRSVHDGPTETVQCVGCDGVDGFQPSKSPEREFLDLASVRPDGSREFVRMRPRVEQPESSHPGPLKITVETDGTESVVNVDPVVGKSGDGIRDPFSPLNSPVAAETEIHCPHCGETLDLKLTARSGHSGGGIDLTGRHPGEAGAAHALWPGIRLDDCFSSGGVTAHRARGRAGGCSEGDGSIEISPEFMRGVHKAAPTDAQLRATIVTWENDGFELRITGKLVDDQEVVLSRTVTVIPRDDESSMKAAVFEAGEQMGWLLYGQGSDGTDSEGGDES